MNTKKLTFSEICQVTDDGNVQLDVEIGDSQGGIITIKKNGEPLVTERELEVKDLSLGKGSNLKEKLLTIDATVDHISDTSNDASLTYRLQDGELPLNQTRPYKFMGDIKTVIFKITIKFK